jgi:hypothetical protein
MQRVPARRHVTTAVVALVLAACAVSGLGVGFASHLALRSLGLSASTPTATVRAAQTTAVSAAPSPSATVTLPVTLPPSGFTLQATATPNVLTSGQPFTLRVVVIAADKVSPVAGAVCYLRASQGAAPPLYAQWPSPQVTDASGTATWDLTAPQQPPGRYVLEVIAYGMHGWSYRWDLSVTLHS